MILILSHHILSHHILLIIGMRTHNLRCFKIKPTTKKINAYYASRATIFFLSLEAI